MFKARFYPKQLINILVAAGLAAGLLTTAPVQIASAAGNVTGTVYVDLNMNGSRDAGEPGAGDPGDTSTAITVTAYDSAGANVAQTTTSTASATLGQYTLDLSLVATGTPLRIEFTGLPSFYQEGGATAGSATSVQFVTTSASAITGVDFAVHNPASYCQNNPYISTTCFINGDPLGGGTSAGLTSVYSLPYSSPVSANTLAVNSQTGPTWGLAYQRSTNTLFAAAIMKRHAAFGTLGTGGIYALTVNPATGTASAIANYIDVKTIGINTGAIPTSHLNANLPAANNTPNTDTDAWDAVGKIGIGGLSISEDETTLWLINLNDGNLYSINVAGAPTTAPTSSTSYSLSSLPGGATCEGSASHADIHPWGVKVHDGYVYVGLICSAENSQNTADLQAYVVRTPESSPGTFSLVKQFALNYVRGIASHSGTGYSARWRPWSATMTALCHSTGVGTCALPFGKQLIYPQPILSDIEFDTDGSMVVAVMDRNGQQTGYNNYAVANAWSGAVVHDDSNNYATQSVNFALNTLFEGVAAGDVLRLCNASGTFNLETNGSCGGVTTAGAGTNQGPGGGEFYLGDSFADPTAASPIHDEVLVGGLLLLPGHNEIVSTAFDARTPGSFEDTGGLRWLSNSAGTINNMFQLFSDLPATAHFGKAAGLGDIEALCDSAPIEIGNRVWKDDNHNGIQDAGESPIGSVTLELWADTDNNNIVDTQVGTATTDASGNYYFGGTTNANMTGGNVLKPNIHYEIRIVNATGASQQSALTGLDLTLTKSDASTNGTLRDNNGSLSSTTAVDAFVTGAAGHNDYSHDFGFFPPATPTPTPTVTATATASPTATATTPPTATATPTATGTAAATATPTSTPTLTRTPTLTATPTRTPTGTLNTPTPTSTPTRTPTGTLATSTPTRTSIAGTPGSATPTPTAHSGTASPPILLDPLLAKSPDIQSVQQGESLKFTITAHNPNSVPISNVVVTDPLPSQVTFKSATTTLGSFTFDKATNTVIFKIGTMPPNSSVTMTVSGVANQSALPPAQFRNTASLTADGGLKAKTSTGGLVQILPKGVIPSGGNGPGPWESLVMALLALAAFAAPLLGWGLWRRARAGRNA